MTLDLTTLFQIPARENNGTELLRLTFGRHVFIANSSFLGESKDYIKFGFYSPY